VDTLRFRGMPRVGKLLGIASLISTLSSSQLVAGSKAFVDRVTLYESGAYADGTRVLDLTLRSTISILLATSL
jgi:hypothetical protein